MNYARSTHRPTGRLHRTQGDPGPIIIPALVSRECHSNAGDALIGESQTDETNLHLPQPYGAL